MFYLFIFNYIFIFIDENNQLMKKNEASEQDFKSFAALVERAGSWKAAAFVWKNTDLVIRETVLYPPANLMNRMNIKQIDPDEYFCTILGTQTDWKISSSAENI